MEKQTAPPRCEFVDEDGKRCRSFRGRETALCPKHGVEYGSPERAREAVALGGMETARAMKEELAAAVAPKAEAPPAADPVGDESKAMQAMLEALGHAEPAEMAGPQRPARDALPPEAKAMRDVLARLIAEREEMLEAQAARRGRKPQENKPLPPLEAFLSVPDDVDLSAMVDENGNSLLTPGFIGRWVRWEVNHKGERVVSQQRLAMYKRWGAKEVMRKDGTPLVDVLGAAIEMPAERWASRAIHNSHGAFDNDLALKALYGQAERLNSKTGKEKVGLVVGDEHGRRTL